MATTSVRNTASPGVETGILFRTLISRFKASLRLISSSQSSTLLSPVGRTASTNQAQLGRWSARRSELSTNHAHVWAVVSVERCGLVRSNILQRQPVLILSGYVRREAAEDDNSDSNQHCREQTYVDLTVDIFHKLPLSSDCRLSVKDKATICRRLTVSRLYRSSCYRA